MKGNIMNEETFEKATKLYSVMVGHDYMTGARLDLATEFDPHRYDEANELIAEHPELMEVARLFLIEERAHIKSNRQIVENDWQRAYETLRAELEEQEDE